MATAPLSIMLSVLCCALILSLGSVWPVSRVDAFHTSSSSSSSSWKCLKQQHSSSIYLSSFNKVASVDINTPLRATEEMNNDDSRMIYTTAILKCSYDGTYYRGFVNNQPKPKQKNAHDNNKTITGDDVTAKPKTRQSRRSRTLQRKGIKKGSMRTVEGTLRSALAKIYGDIKLDQITMDACSRTDAGVHATSLIAQFYCTKSNHDGDSNGNNSTQTTIPIRPTGGSNNTDDLSNFLPLPFESDLSKLVFVLNRMLPPDVRVVAAAPMPRVPSSIPHKGTLPIRDDDGTVAFHPTLHTKSKTYTYKFAIGPVHDPLQTQYVWHLDGSSSRAVGMNGDKFSLERALQAAQLFVDSNDVNMNIDTAVPRDYGAFRAAFRGTDRGRVQSTMCKLWRCDIVPEREELLSSWSGEACYESDTTTNGGSNAAERCKPFGSRLGKSFIESDIPNPRTFTIVITGDRFLYKMVRNIVGTIVAVGCDHLEITDVNGALETGSWGGCESDTEETDSGASVTSSERTIRRICAPARGLTLTEVQYPKEVFLDWRSG